MLLIGHDQIEQMETHCPKHWNFQQCPSCSSRHVQRGKSCWRWRHFFSLSFCSILVFFLSVEFNSTKKPLGHVMNLIVKICQHKVDCKTLHWRKNWNHKQFARWFFVQSTILKEMKNNVKWTEHKKWWWIQTANNGLILCQILQFFRLFIGLFQKNGTTLELVWQYITQSTLSCVCSQQESESIQLLFFFLFHWIVLTKKRRR